jgi:hypothetical protein
MSKSCRAWRWRCWVSWRPASAAKEYTNRNSTGGYGEVHIEARHGQEIRALVDDSSKPLYLDAAEFVADVTANFTDIYKNENGGLLLVKQNGNAKLLVVSLWRAPAGKGKAYWNVITGGPRRPESLKKMKPLWSQPGPADPSTPRGGTSFIPGAEQ